jgi:hypothetical protein
VLPVRVHFDAESNHVANLRAHAPKETGASSDQRRSDEA